MWVCLCFLGCVVFISCTYTMYRNSTCINTHTYIYVLQSPKYIIDNLFMLHPAWISMIRWTHWHRSKSSVRNTRIVLAWIYSRYCPFLIICIKHTMQVVVCHVLCTPFFPFCLCTNLGTIFGRRSENAVSYCPRAFAPHGNGSISMHRHGSRESFVSASRSKQPASVQARPATTTTSSIECRSGEIKSGRRWWLRPGENVLGRWGSCGRRSVSV